MDNRHGKHSKGYTKGIFWPNAIVPVVALGHDNRFRLEHSGEVLTGCDGNSSDSWNWDGAQVAPFDSSEPILGRGGFMTGILNDRLSELSGSLIAIQQPRIAQDLGQLFSLVGQGTHACVGTMVELTHKRTLLFAKLMRACLANVTAPCPHRRMIAWHTREMEIRGSGQLAWAALYRFSSEKDRSAIAQQFITFVDMSDAFAADERSWTEPQYTPREQRIRINQGLAKLDKLWADLLRYFEVPVSSPIA